MSVSALKTDKAKGKKPSLKVRKTLAEIKGCLELKYQHSGNLKNWLIRGEMDRAKKMISQGKNFYLKRAQWGAKWGNYYHLIDKNSKGHYQFVEGFNPSKHLL